MIHYVEYVLSGTVTDNDGHRLQIGSARWGCGTVELAVKFKLPVIGVACAGLCLLLRVVLRPWVTVTSGLRNSM
jgi:hypothetical protein